MHFLATEVDDAAHPAWSASDARRARSQESCRIGRQALSEPERFGPHRNTRREAQAFRRLGACGCRERIASKVEHGAQGAPDLPVPTRHAQSGWRPRSDRRNWRSRSANLSRAVAHSPVPARHVRNQRGTFIDPTTTFCMPPAARAIVRSSRLGETPAFSNSVSMLTILALTSPCAIVSRPTVTGNLNRRGPALPGLKYSTPSRHSIEGWWE